MFSWFGAFEKIEVLEFDVLKKEKIEFDGKNGEIFWTSVSKGTAWLPKGKARTAI